MNYGRYATKAGLARKIGELLSLMISESFNIFVTVDRNLQYQQNMERFSLTIFVLCANNNRRNTLQKFIPKVLEKIAAGNLKNIVEIK